MFDEIMSIEEVEDAECMDIWVWDERCQDELGGNFLINDLVVHNSIPEAMENRDDESQSWYLPAQKLRKQEMPLQKNGLTS
jgi:hypothetical protein